MNFRNKICRKQDEKEGKTPEEYVEYWNKRDAEDFAAFDIEFDLFYKTSSVSIPFFQDSGTEFNELPVRLAEIGVTRGQLNSKQTELSLLKQVASIYWDLVGLLETIEVKKKAVELDRKSVV